MQAELCQISITEIDPGMATILTHTTSVFNRIMLPVALLYNIEKTFPSFTEINFNCKCVFWLALIKSQSLKVMHLKLLNEEK